MYHNLGCTKKCLLKHVHKLTLFCNIRRRTIVVMREESLLFNYEAQDRKQDRNDSELLVDRFMWEKAELTLTSFK